MKLKAIIWLITSLVIILITYWLKKRKKTKSNKRIINYQRDNDWSKVKEIPVINCVQCEECIRENNGCCSNCSINSSVSEETHCKEHHHKYSHYHSPKISQKLIILPLILAAIIIWLVKKITKLL